MNRIDFLFAREVMAAGSYAVDFGVAALMKQRRHDPISGVRRIFYAGCDKIPRLRK